MALVLSLAVGDVVDIADYTIAVHSVESRKTATLITKDGQKIPISSKYETEIMPTIWVQLGPWTGKRHLKLLFTDEVIVRNRLVEVKLIEQVPLALTAPTHHHPLPSPIARGNKNHARHRPSTDFCNTIGQ